MNWSCRWRVADDGTFCPPRRNADQDTAWAAEIANVDFDVATTAVFGAYPVLVQIFVGNIRPYVSPDSQAGFIRQWLLTGEDAAIANIAEQDATLGTAERELVQKGPARRTRRRPNRRSQSRFRKQTRRRPFRGHPQIAWSRQKGIRSP